MGIRKWLDNPAYSLSFSWCINSLAYSIVYPFIPLYLHSARQIPMSTVGLIFPVMGAGVMCGPLLAGWLVDRFGRKSVMLHGTTGRGMIFLMLTLMAMFDALFWAFCVMMFINAFVGTFFQNASDAYLADTTTDAERPAAYSRIRVGTNVGWALGPIIGSFLARTPFSLLFFLTALLCFAGSVFISACIGESRPAHGGMVRRKMEPFAWRDLHMAYLMTVFFSFVLYMLISQLYTTLSVYSTGVVGISRNNLGLVYSVNGLGIVLLQIPITRLLDRFRVAGMSRIMTGAALYGAGYFAVAFCGGAIQIALAIMIITLGEIVLQPAVYTAVTRMSPSRCLGRFMGVFGMMRGLGFAVGPYFGGLLFDACVGRPVALWGWLASASLVSMAGFAAVALLERRRNGHR